MVNKNSPIWRRARFAWRGLLVAIRDEASFRAELWSIAVAIVVLIGLRASWLWWALALLLMAALLATELLNSAIESLADLVSPEFHPLVARAKDCGAAAVLVISVSGGLLILLLLWHRLHLGVG